MSRKVTALTIYIIVCLFVVGMALIEYAFVLGSIRLGRTKKIHSNSSKMGGDQEQLSVYLFVDKIAFSVSLAVFIVFNFVYFFSYMKG